MRQRALFDRQFAGVERKVSGKIAERYASALSESLVDKARIFESRLSDFQPAKDKLLFGDSASFEAGPISNPHCEANAHYLIVLALKQLLLDKGVDLGLEDNRSNSATAVGVVRGLIEMDKLDGEFGYIPLRVRFNSESGEFEVKDPKTKSNSYSQILFAYAIAHRALPECRQEISTHVSAIVQRLLANEFRVISPDGKVASDLSPSSWGLFNPSRYLDALLAIEAGLQLGSENLTHGEGAERLLDLRQSLIGNYESPKGFERYVLNKLLYVKLGAHQLPTVSSCVLNMMKLSGLLSLRRDSIAATAYYSDIMSSMWTKLVDQCNPLVDLLGVAFGGKVQPDTQLLNERAAATLQSFHTYPDHFGHFDLSAFCTKGLKIREKGLKCYPKADQVLPVFARPWSPFIWKMDATTCHHSHTLQSPIGVANGLDYLMAYYLLHCSSRGITLS